MKIKITVQCKYGVFSSEPEDVTDAQALDINHMLEQMGKLSRFRLDTKDGVVFFAPDVLKDSIVFVSSVE